ncbi:MAG: TonB-dependent receptor, partial [Deltaproteobacteria bacterium]
MSTLLAYRSPAVNALILFCLSGLLTSPAAAQDPGALRGTVVEAATLRPINGVDIRIEGVTRNVITDSAGVFRVSALHEGLYVVSARRLGYTAARQVNVRVTRGKTTMVEFALEPVAVRLDAARVEAAPITRDPEAPVGRFDYSAEEIRRTPGAAGDIFRAIETLPGVSSSGGEFSAFSVRGGGPRDNLIFIDEIPFDKVTHLEGGIESDEAQGGRFSIFAPDLVHSAEFQAGGFAAQYGGKSASLLRLRLKDGNAETPTVTGRYDLLGWEADYDGPSKIDDRTSVLFSARHENLARALKLIGRGDAGTPSFTDVIAKTSTTINARNKLTLLGILAPERVVRTVDNVLEEPDTNDTALYAWSETKSVIGATWQLLAGHASVIQTSAYARRFTRSNALGDSYPDIPIAGGTSIAERQSVRTDDRSESEVGVRSVARLSAGRDALILSIEAAGRETKGGRAVAGGDTLFTFDHLDQRPSPDQYFLVITPDRYDSRYSHRGTQLAASSSYEHMFGGDGSAIIGGRYEHSALTGRNDVVPRASIAFPTVAGLSFNVAGGVYLQDADLQLIAANPNNAFLPPERSTHLIGGVSRLIRPDVRLSVEGYYRTLNDITVVQDRTTGLAGATGTGFASGVDVDLVKRLTDRVFGQV